MSKGKTWALVTDSVRARILRGLEEDDAQDRIELISKARMANLRDFIADRASRVGTPDKDGGRDERAAGVEATRRDAQAFARETLSLLDQHRRAGDFDRLAVFAPPRMLDLLRLDMPPSLRRSVVLECAADLVPLPGPVLRAEILILLRAGDVG